jgi:putative ABC transport system substrate-binding protein
MQSPQSSSHWPLSLSTGATRALAWRVTKLGRRSFSAALGVAALAAGVGVRAQAQRPLRVAWLSSDSKNSPSPNLAAFRDGMRELGRVEGPGFKIETWWAEGSAERMTQLAPDVLRSQPAIVVASGGLALFALQGAGATMPIVFSISADPVEAGVVDSFARPGRNMTGISLFTLALVGKRLELLKAMLPSARRIAAIANPQHPGETKERDAAQRAASSLQVAMRYFPVQSEGALDAALAEIRRGRDDAVLAFADGFMLGFAGRLASFSQSARIPVVDGWAPFAHAGNLMTYGPVITDVYRRLAVYVDRIANGARPAELPIELPTKVELVVNLKSAQALGIAVPQSVLSRADVLIR